MTVRTIKNHHPVFAKTRIDTELTSTTGTTARATPNPTMMVTSTTLADLEPKSPAGTTIPIAQWIISLCIVAAAVALTIIVCLLLLFKYRSSEAQDGI
jgi:hypothetical protein